MILYYCDKCLKQFDYLSVLIVTLKPLTIGHEAEGGTSTVDHQLCDDCAHKIFNSCLFGGWKYEAKRKTIRTLKLEPKTDVKGIEWVREMEVE